MWCWTVSPWCVNSVASERRALARPSSSRTPGRSRRAMRRISSRPARVASWARVTSSRSSPGTRSATRLSWRRTAVRVWPTSSWSSRAMRCRSRSWACSARPAPAARSAWSRSSIVLYVSISCAASAGPPTSGRVPGPSRSAVVMARPRRCSGVSPMRSTTALPASRAARPPSRTRASPASTGVDTVTGPSSSAVATTRPAALSRKIRQNSDTFLFPLLPASSHDTPAASFADRDRLRTSVTTPISPRYVRMAAWRGRAHVTDVHEAPAGDAAGNAGRMRG